MRNNGSVKIIALSCIALIMLGGAGYWYLEMYQSKQFAKELVFLYEDTVAQVFRTETPKVPVRDAIDYAGARSELAARKEYFERAKRKLEQLTPPLFGDGKQWHRLFLEFIDGELVVLNALERKAEFFEKAVKFNSAFGSPFVYREDDVVGFVTMLRDRIGNLLFDGKKLFDADAIEYVASLDILYGPGIPPGRTDDASYEMLRSLWRELEPYLEVMGSEVSLTHNFEGTSVWPRTVSKKDVNRRFPPFSNKTAIEKNERFGILLRAAIFYNSAEDMARERFYINLEQEDDERRQKTFRLIENLKTGQWNSYESWEAEYQREQKARTLPPPSPPQPDIPAEVIEDAAPVR